jgi:dTDP-4-amino-4,6-dideoxy-D-galactose acyltransferase
MHHHSTEFTRFLDWDSAHFGIRIGRVLPASIDREILRSAADWADSTSVDCMYLLVDSNDPDAVRIAGESGWRMVDMRVTLGANVHDNAVADNSLREATADDIPYLRQLARRSHKDSRFYSDGRFPAPACDELYAKWIERSVRDRDFAGAVFVPQTTEDRAAGYITCAIKEGVGDIGLIAVDEEFRRLGIGKKLLAESVRWFARQGAERVLVVTQGRNIPALRMYERAGFNVESIQLWFHRWRTS